MTYFEVVEDVADECDIADPLLQRTPPCLLAVLELLLEPVQQVPPEHISIALLGLSLHGLMGCAQKVRKHSGVGKLA